MNAFYLYQNAFYKKANGHWRTTVNSSVAARFGEGTRLYLIVVYHL